MALAQVSKLRRSWPTNSSKCHLWSKVAILAAPRDVLLIVCSGFGGNPRGQKWFGSEDFYSIFNTNSPSAPGDLTEWNPTSQLSNHVDDKIRRLGWGLLFLWIAVVCWITRDYWCPSIAHRRRRAKLIALEAKMRADEAKQVAEDAQLMEKC